MQLARRAGARGHAHRERAAFPSADHVAHVIPDEDVHLMGAQRGTLRPREQRALDGVGGDADAFQARLSERGALGGDDDDATGEPAHRLHRGARVRHRPRRGNRVHRVQLPVAGGDGGDVRGGDVRGGEPVGELVLQRRSEPGDDQIGVDGHTGLAGQGGEGRADAGAGVQQGQIEVETDHRG